MFFIVNTDDLEFVRGEEGSWIPRDEANTDYQAFLAWCDEGNTPEPWNPDTP